MPPVTDISRPPARPGTGLAAGRSWKGQLIGVGCCALTARAPPAGRRLVQRFSMGGHHPCACRQTVWGIRWAASARRRPPNSSCLGSIAAPLSGLPLAAGQRPEERGGSRLAVRPLPAHARACSKAPRSVLGRISRWTCTPTPSFRPCHARPLTVMGMVLITRRCLSSELYATWSPSFEM